MGGMHRCKGLRGEIILDLSEGGLEDKETRHSGRQGWEGGRKLRDGLVGSSYPSTFDTRILPTVLLHYVDSKQLP